MTYEEIHKTLNGEGFTWASAAESIECKESQLIAVSARKSSSKPVAQRLSALLERSVEEVFPDKPKYHEPIKNHKKAVEKGRERLKKAGLAATV